MGRHGGRPSLDRFPGCKGLQPSKANNGLRGPDHDLEGAGPSAPRSSIENFVWFVAVRHELEGRRLRRSSGRRKRLPSKLSVSRLRGTAALKVNNDHQSFVGPSILPSFHPSISRHAEMPLYAENL